MVDVAWTVDVLPRTLSYVKIFIGGRGGKNSRREETSIAAQICGFEDGKVNTRVRPDHCQSAMGYTVIKDTI